MTCPIMTIPIETIRMRTINGMGIIIRIRKNRSKRTVMSMKRMGTIIHISRMLTKRTRTSAGYMATTTAVRMEGLSVGRLRRSTSRSV